MTTRTAVPGHQSRPNSPYIQDLIDLAQLPDFDRLQDQIQRLAGCRRPIRLSGTTTTTDAATGAVLRSYSTASEPLGRLLLPCGNRRATRCPTCSAVYASDTYQLIKAGLAGGKEVPDTVRAHPRVFATLTAPSFGPVHNRPTTATGHHRPCRCGTTHDADAPILGTPVHPATYDYAGAVLFNAHAGALWARFTTYLRREIARRTKLTVKQLREVARLSFAKVAEFQKRGLVHFHAVIRLDGPEGSTTPPPPWATADLLTAAITTAVPTVRLTTNSDAVGERHLHWGAQLDVREITAPGGSTPLTDTAVAAYVAKYATKSAETSGTVDRPLHCLPCNGHGWTRTPAGLGDECQHCHGTGQAEPIRDLHVATHVRQMIRTCWDLGQHPEFAPLKLWKWAHMLGFKGHFSTKSRRYSTTLGALRGARRTWRTEQARLRHNLPEFDPATTLVISRWTYLGSGYSPGEELLAEHIRHTRTRERQARHEGEDRP